MKIIDIKHQIFVIITFSMIFLNSCNCCQKRKERKAATKAESNECHVRCNQSPDPGNCRAYFPRYYFDKEEGKCKEFIWGGCEGVVPFNTLEECENCNCD